MGTRGSGSSKRPKKQPMSVNERVQIAFEEGTVIDEALNETRLEAIRQHKQSGHPMVVWRNGKTVLLPAEQVEAELNAEKSRNGPRASRKQQTKKR
jgi:hypothetical protein